MRVQGHVGGLDTRLLDQQVLEHAVHGVEDRRCRPEVLDQRDQLEAKRLARLVVDPQIGAAEPVDRLLGVTDQRQRARADRAVGPPTRCELRIRRGQQHRELGLQRVGVLELVDQQAPVARRGGGPRLGVVPQQVAGQDEQVVEPQPALESTLVGVGARERREPAGQHRERAAALLVEDVDTEALDVGAGLTGRVDVVPAALLAPVALPVRDGLDGREHVELVGRGGEGVTDRRERVDVRREQVGVVVASLPPDRQKVVDRLAQVRGAQRWDRRRAGRPRQAVVVLAERERDGSQPRHGQAGRQPHGEHRLQVAVREEGVDQRGPVLLEIHAGLDRLENAEARRQPDLEGMLAQQARREAVQRRQRGLVELVERLAAPPPCVRVARLVIRAGRGVLQSSAHPVAELRGGRLGEGDRREVTQLDVAVGDERDDTVDERGRLPGAGTGLHEQAHVVPVADTCPRGRVADGAHAGSVRRRNPSSTGSSAFRVQVVARSTGQSRSYGQLAQWSNVSCCTRGL